MGLEQKVPRSYTYTCTCAFPRPLVNYAASEPPGPPGASRSLLGHAGAPRSLKLCKTSVSLETSSNILRGGCAIRERARAKSTCYSCLCPGRSSGLRDLSRILRNTRCGGCAIRERARAKSTLYHLLCPGRSSGPRDLSRILRNTRCGGCAIRERAREKSAFC